MTCAYFEYVTSKTRMHWTGNAITPFSLNKKYRVKLKQNCRDFLDIKLSLLNSATKCDKKKQAEAC